MPLCKLADTPAGMVGVTNPRIQNSFKALSQRLQLRLGAPDPLSRRYQLVPLSLTKTLL